MRFRNRQQSAETMALQDDESLQNQVLWTSVSSRLEAGRSRRAVRDCPAVLLVKAQPPATTSDALRSSNMTQVGGRADSKSWAGRILWRSP